VHLIDLLEGSLLLLLFKFQSSEAHKLVPRPQAKNADHIKLNREKNSTRMAEWLQPIRI
jgi:hypothetical protein